MTDEHLLKPEDVGAGGEAGDVGNGGGGRKMYHSAPSSPHMKLRGVAPPAYSTAYTPPVSIKMQNTATMHRQDGLRFSPPSPSFLTVEQPTVQLRESTLTIGFPSDPALNSNNNANENGNVEEGEDALKKADSLLVTFSDIEKADGKIRETDLLNDDDDEADKEELSLMYARHEKIPMKDFAAEYRASVEVEKFLDEATLLLNLHESQVESILHKMLIQMLGDHQNKESLMEQAMQALFTHDGVLERTENSIFSMVDKSPVVGRSPIGGRSPVGSPVGSLLGSPVAGVCFPRNTFTPQDNKQKGSTKNNKVHQLGKTIQGSCNTAYGGFDIDQSWLCILCTLPTVTKRRVAIARLHAPANMGHTSNEIYFVILVLAPTKDKGTKNALETGRTFATIFADIDVRSQLLAAHNEDEFKQVMAVRSKELADQQSHKKNRRMSMSDHKQQAEQIELDEKARCWFGGGLVSDFTRRLKYYPSDFKDGIMGHRTLQKTCSTTLFLYFACLLPCIALGALNDTNTHGEIDVKKVIYSQTIGGLFFAIFGGQPMVILLTTAPLALYTKVIYTICAQLDLNFLAMFAMTGIWNSVFLIIYSLVGASRLMKWSTRSTEEIFALFISIAFTVDTVKDIVHDFQINYNTPACDEVPDHNLSATAAPIVAALPTTDSVLQAVTNAVTNTTDAYGDDHGIGECLRENSLLFLLLVLGTVWLGLALFNFTKTPFLNANKRELLADYSLPVAVLFMSFFGSYVFKDVKLVPFSYDDGPIFKLAPLGELSATAVVGAMGLGFCLSLLFFMDQNISGAMVNSPDHKLKKGPAYHWDLLVVAILNAFLTLFGLPMMHGALPHSPLHVIAMADTEDRVDQGHVTSRIMHARETRITPILSHILIGLSILMLPTPLSFIPRPVLDGLFLYLAVTALGSNQMFERITLLVTEQSAYPPNHYIRSVPQRKIHLFTLFQIIQLAIMCAFGFSPIPYMKMVFPVLILLLLPIRHKLIPKAIEDKYLDAIDGH